MPLSDAQAKKVASHWLLYKSICRHCGALNPFGAKKCRRCHSHDLREKSREVSK